MSDNGRSGVLYFLAALADLPRPGELTLSQNISIVEAAQLLGLNRDTVRELVKKGQIKGYKKTIGRTSPFVIDKDTVLDYDRRRREQTTPAH